jgi:hypothetical protein
MQYSGVWIQKKRAVNRRSELLQTQEIFFKVAFGVLVERYCNQLPSISRRSLLCSSRRLPDVALAQAGAGGIFSLFS